jgi:plastocyanin
MPIAECLVVMTLLGCERSPAETARIDAREVRGDAKIVGRVRFEGSPPVMRPIANQPCHEGAAAINEEFVIVGKTGGLKNVFVYVESKALPKMNGASLEAVVLDQVNCRYEPHVLGVCVGQPVRVKSSDPKTMHNVHYSPMNNDARNFAMTDAGEEKNVSFQAHEFIQVKCDVHPWMTAHVGVFDTPFHDVTDDNGEFEIKNLPSGSYKLIAWHERYGRMEQNVNAGETAPRTSEFVFKAPTGN